VARTAAQVTTAVPMAARTVARTAAQVTTAVPMAARTAAQVTTAARTAEQTVAQATDLAVEPGAAPAEGGTGDRPALRRCTHVEPAEFAASVWGRRASLSPRELLPGGFADLLDPAAVDTLLSRRGLRTPFLRVARDGRTLPEARFTRPGGVGAAIGDQADDAALTRHFAEGSTIVLQGLHRTHEPVLAFVQALAADLGHPVQANAYVTPPQNQGFAAHYDVHDVFVLQVGGEKRWTVHEPVLPHPRRDQPWTGRRAAVEAAAAREPLLDVVLRPGDALYLPAGFLHSAQALGETSIHLTLGVHVWTRAHLLAALVARLGDVEDLRTPLPLGVDVTDPAALAPALAAVVAALGGAAPGVTAGDVAPDLGRQAAAATRAEPVAVLAQARAVDAVDLWTRLRWRRGLAADLTSTTGDDGVPGLRIRTPETTVTVHAAAADAVRRLLAGDVLAVAALGTGPEGPVEDAERLELARVLLRSALVVPQ